MDEELEPDQRRGLVASTGIGHPEIARNVIPLP